MTPGQQAQQRELSALQSVMQTIRMRNADRIAAEVIAKAARKPRDGTFGWPVLGGAK